MSIYNLKCIVVIAEDLPLGLIANAAAVMGVSIGNKVQDILGQEGVDASGSKHLGLVKVPVPILKATRKQIKELREAATKTESILTVDFSNPALKAKTDKEYLDQLATMTTEELEYISVALCGPKSEVSEMTKTFSVYR